VKAGKIRYFGSSTFAAWQLVESFWVSEKLGLNRFVTEQPPYNLMDRRIERELLPMAQTFGMGVIPWSPLAGGFLSGKYKRGEGRPEDARIDPETGRGQQLYSEQGFDIVERLVELAEAKGCTPSQLALAWCVNQPGVTSPIIGPKRLEQLEDNLGALEVEVTDEDREKLDEVAIPGRMTATYYRASFGPHPHRV
jgi:aryl-alcohol dehydrogenase-like predicted oxidoreductase